MKDLKVVFFDIDGTLVSFDTHRIPQSTIEAINELRKKDIKLIISTGRSLGDINNLGDLQFDAYITANGAYCVDANKKLIDVQLIPSHNLDRLVQFLGKKPVPCIFMTEQGNFANKIDDRVLALNKQVNLPTPEVKSLEEIVRNRIFQIDIFVDDQEEHYLFEHILPNCEGSRWHPDFTDITLKGTNKARGVQILLDRFGFSKEQAMAFGDGGNDVEMLRYVKTGIAMGNANDNVKAEANYVTSPIDEDGVMNALKHFGVL